MKGVVKRQGSPVAERPSLDSQPHPHAFRFCLDCSSFLAELFIVIVERTPSTFEADKRTDWQRCQPWSYSRLEAYDFLRLSKGA